MIYIYVSYFSGLYQTFGSEQYTEFYSASVLSAVKWLIHPWKVSDTAYNVYKNKNEIVPTSSIAIAL